MTIGKITLCANSLVVRILASQTNLETANDRGSNPCWRMNKIKKWSE